MTSAQSLAMIAAVGLGVLSVLTRSFFFLVKSDWQLPKWLEDALRYAPIAALAAVVLPEVLSDQGAMKSMLGYAQDAKIYGAVTCIVYFALRRGLLGSILSGAAVYLALRLGFNW